MEGRARELAASSPRTRETPLRVLFCSRIRLYREGLVEVMRRRGFAMTGTEPPPLGGSAPTQEPDPDVVLVDLAEPSGIDAIRHFVAARPASPVVALGVAEREVEVIYCAEAGVAAYVTRDCLLLGCVRQRATPMGSRCAPLRVMGVLVGEARRGLPAHSAASLRAARRKGVTAPRLRPWATCSGTSRRIRSTGGG
jgi:DNA-binding NarL/FixJ family response regulator